MAYAAVVSLMQILKQLLHSDQYHVIHPYPKSQIESLHGKVSSLQSSLEKIFPVPRRWRGEANDLEIQIRDVIYEAQDTIELFISRQIRSSESEEALGDQSSTSLFLQEIIAKLDPIIKMAENIIRSIGISEEYTTSEKVLPSKSSSSSASTRIVGLEKDLQLLMAELFSEEDSLQVIKIVGMGGIGKTTLAKMIYDDQGIRSHFHIRAWVTVSQEYHIGEILSNVLNSMEHRGRTQGDEVSQGSEEQLRVRLFQCLYNNRYLIVMDDIWDLEVWDRVRNCLPDNKNGSRIILTSRIVSVARSISPEFHNVMHPLDQENSWTLLCEKVFGDAPCPPELESIGRNIAANCGGMPLSIVVVGALLFRERKTVEYWRSIEEDTHVAAAKGEESFLEILSLSYNQLPAKLKGCFLYIGAFPKDSEILVSKLIKLWVAEGFLAPPSPTRTLEHIANQHLYDLIDRNLISACKISSNGLVKTCSMHDILREFALQECQREKFFHAINRYAQELLEGAENQRRVSVHNNILMCTEDVYQCTKSIELARTLLYAGPDHYHPLPLCLTFELLRVLDALAVYFIELPDELFELVHLRYLAFTYDEDLPPSISKLRNLMILMVRQHPKIILRRTSILPVEIWNMPQLRHLLLTESFLPGPPTAQNSVLLENLQSLSNVNAACCSNEMLQNMPNLKKLGIWVEEPCDVHLYIHQLQHLEVFKFMVLKPIPGKRIDFLPELLFPETLKKLSLSGCGLAWEDMAVIGQLPCLEVLKLREFAFQGPEWSLEEGGYTFESLKFLLLESLDLKMWDADYSHFPRLERLIIRHCYELEEIPLNIGYIGYLELIKLVDCSPDAVASVEDIREEQEGLSNQRLQVDIYSSWE